MTRLALLLSLLLPACSTQPLLTAEEQAAPIQRALNSSPKETICAGGHSVTCTTF